MRKTQHVLDAAKTQYNASCPNQPHMSTLGITTLGPDNPQILVKRPQPPVWYPPIMWSTGSPTRRWLAHWGLLHVFLRQVCEVAYLRQSLVVIGIGRNPIRDWRGGAGSHRVMLGAITDVDGRRAARCVTYIEEIPSRSHACSVCLAAFLKNRNARRNNRHP